MNKADYQHQQRFDNAFCTLIVPVAKGDAFSLHVKMFAPSEILNFPIQQKNNYLFLAKI